jgi:hypothetical protein
MYVLIKLIKSSIYVMTRIVHKKRLKKNVMTRIKRYIPCPPFYQIDHHNI